MRSARSTLLEFQARDLRAKHAELLKSTVPAADVRRAVDRVVEMQRRLDPTLHRLICSNTALLPDGREPLAMLLHEIRAILHEARHGAELNWQAMVTERLTGR